MELFDCVVLENGGVLYSPSKRQTTVLCPPASLDLARELEKRGVEPVLKGQAILATRRPHEVLVLEAIRDLGLELQIIFNGDAVMVLPSGVNKGSGLKAALREMGLSAHEVVGVGNAENDHSFLDICACAVAVDNAVAAIRAKVDFCTRGADGSGVAELIDELVTTDLSGRTPRDIGDPVVLADRRDGTSVTFPPYGHNILVSGPSGAGKSSFATGLIERLIDRSYQLCIIDPEGDYSTVDEVVTFGSRLRAPHVDEILELLRDSEANIVVNLLGIPLEERPDFFSQLYPRLQAMRARTGRPHWIVIDEVHHLLPAIWGLAPSTLPQRIGETILITVRPGEVGSSILALVDTVVAVGPSHEEALADFASTLGIALPVTPLMERTHKDVVIWQRTAGLDPFTAAVVPARSARLRHLRKYAEGNLGPKSFFFRGPDDKMNLRAQNLVAFSEMAAGVDDSTWLFHLLKGDYSEWFRTAIKDEDLADEVASVEQASRLTPLDSRRIIHDAIDRRYMLPS
jgi:3-deoxy-D-manno-octulosonate 8-phosphate phosphatase KdsC-like HAD superfamily phosphatase